ncbi:MAG: 2-C-methyl-D-erythritol 2,4-cyclodiphosphate synthase [Chloroflexota bacterium]
MIDLRIGSGLDVHAFATGRRLVIAGVEIPHPRGLEGHSDGDPAIHALIDALLGAASLPDIGQRFPSSEPRYAGANSLDLLAEVARDLEQRQWRLVNADITIIAQEPRLSTYVPRMKQVLTERLQVDLDQIGIKATTTDHLGALGRAEGVGALAVALLQRGEPG